MGLVPLVVLLLASSASAARGDERCDGNDPLRDLSSSAASGSCGLDVLRGALQHGAASERLRAVEALGYVARFRLHFEATALLRAMVEKRDGDNATRMAALSALRSAGLGVNSKETDMTRYATHVDPAVRAAFIDVVTRDCDRGDRPIVEAALSREADATLQAKWRAALVALDACPGDELGAALRSVIKRERTLRSLACEEASLVVNDHFIVENATVERAHPHVSARRTGAQAVAALHELDELLGHVSADGLHCKASECVHHGRINGWDFAFWFAPDSTKQTRCVTRIVRTKHEMEPQLH